MLAWAAWQLHYSPTACGTLRKQFTKLLEQVVAPPSTYLGLCEEGGADHLSGRGPQEEHVQPLKVGRDLQPVAVLLPGRCDLRIFSGRGGLERRVQDGRRVDRFQAAEAAVSGGENTIPSSVLSLYTQYFL